MAAQKPNNRSNGNNNTTYTPSRFSSYDSAFSSLSWTWANDNAMLNIAPIEPNMIGKTPKRGEKVYDYDNRLSFFVSPAMAKAFIRAIAELREIVDGAEESGEYAYDRVTVEDSGSDTYRSLTLIRPNGIAIKVAGRATKFDGYVLQGRVSKGGEDEETFFHVFPNNAIKFIKRESASNIEELEVVHESDLEIFIDFLHAVVDNAVALSAHTAQRVIRNIGSTGGNTNKRRPFSNMAEEFDEDDEGGEVPSEEDDEAEEAPRSSKKTAARKPVGKSPAKSRRGSLEEEFDDDIPM